MNKSTTVILTIKKDLTILQDYAMMKVAYYEWLKENGYENYIEGGI